MPNGVAYLDTFSPSTNERTTEEQIRYITEYLHNLSEQLRFDLNNLGPENFSEAGLAELKKMIGG